MLQETIYEDLLKDLCYEMGTTNQFHGMCDLPPPQEYVCVHIPGNVNTTLFVKSVCKCN